ncbi:ATP-binding protein [Dactylosporangium sp. CA-139066]|uniref:ATP-binding protein n=1 Tax=Dactylosporangium sp. CA-139066 TaxID=3239930 RepID=UPI003D9371E2
MDNAAPGRPVATRVGLVLLVPLLGLLGLAGVAAYGYATQMSAAATLQAAVAAGAAADRAATELSRERYAAAEYLLTGTDQARAAFTARFAAVDRAVAALPAAAPLPALRAEALGGAEVGAAEVLMGYNQLESDLVAFRQSVAARPGPATVLAAARASGWLAVAREELAQIQLLDLRGADTPARREALAAHRATHLDALRRFADAAPAALRTRLERVPSGLAGDAQPALDALADLAAASGAGESESARAARDRGQRIAIGGLAVVLLLAAASVTLTALVARSLRRRLTASRSRAAARPSPDGAGYFLAPNRSRQRPPATGLDLVQLTVTPVPTADRPPLRPEPGAPARRADDPGGPAGPRAESPAALVALARRSQRLADALVERLDAAERDEADPDRLAELFAFDHLATRIRHDTQSLLVLAGADSATGRRDPVGLLDLLRAAQSRIEDYRRIEYAMIAPDVRIAPEAADDVVHLLAELFDNAARNGPPDRPVLVEGRRAADGAEVEIADRGPGLSPARRSELNARLAADRAGPAEGRPAADARRTGLAVVGRLAARHGVVVTLRPQPSGTGLRVLVALPAALVLPAPDASATPAVRRTPAARRRPLPGGEPVDVPHPRSTLVPVVRGPVPTPDGPTVDVEPQAVRNLLTGYQQAITQHPVTASTNTEGRPSA